MIDINTEFEKNRFVGIKDNSIGLFHRMSIPFRYFENKIHSVFVEYNSNKDKIRDFFEKKLIQAKYYKNSETVYCHILNHQNLNLIEQIMV